MRALKIGVSRSANCLKTVNIKTIGDLVKNRFRCAEIQKFRESRSMKLKKYLSKWLSLA